MKHISKAHGGPTDTSRDYDMTDWQGIRNLADDLAAIAQPLERAAHA